MRRFQTKVLKVRPKFLLSAFNKMWEEGKKQKKDLLNGKDPGCADLGNSQPMKMTKDAKIKRFLLKVWHNWKLWVWLYNLLLYPGKIKRSEMKGLPHRPQSNRRAWKELIGNVPQPSQLMPKVEKELSQKKSEDECFDWMNSPQMHIKSQGTWEYFICRSTAGWAWKGQKEYEIKGDAQHPQILLAGSRGW